MTTLPTTSKSKVVPKNRKISRSNKINRNRRLQLLGSRRMVRRRGRLRSRCKGMQGRLKNRIKFSNNALKLSRNNNKWARLRRRRCRTHPINPKNRKDLTKKSSNNLKDIRRLSRLSKKHRIEGWKTPPLFSRGNSPRIALTSKPCRI